jgi:hypothetical protein
MDSPIHPDLKPGHKPQPPQPLSVRHPSLIQGNDIELAPTQRSFQEHVTNPAPEPFGHSTLELAKPAFQPQPHPHLYAVDPDQKYAKAWESQGRSHSIYAPTQVSGSGSTERYSHSDFSTPFDQQPLVVPPQGKARPKRERICGVRRQLFWIILAIALFLAVAAIATGVGVGVAMSGQNGSGGSPTATPSSTRTLPVPVATSTPTAMSCPANNLTLYSSATNPKKKYLLLCGRDYNSNLGTTQDLYNAATDTLPECLELCAGQDGCVGAGWGSGSYADGQPTCWLKSKLGVANTALTWSFFVQDSGT